MFMSCLQLSSTILDTLGPFVLVNALRVLAPEATHTLIISFTPTAGHIVSRHLFVGLSQKILSWVAYLHQSNAIVTKRINP